MADNVVDILLRARMEAGDVASGVDSIQKALNGLTLPKNISGDLDKQFTKLTPLIKEYQKQLDKGFKTPKDLKNLELLKEKIADSFGSIQSSLQQLNGQEIRFKTDTESIAKMEKQLDGLRARLNDKLANIFKKDQTSTGVIQGIKGITNALNAQFSTGKFKFPALKELANDLDNAFKSKNYASFNSQLDTIKNKITSLSDSSKIDIAKSLASTDLGKALKLDKTISDVGTAKKVIDDFFNAVTVNRTSANGVERLNTQIKDLQGAIAQTKTDSLVKGMNEVGSAQGGIEQLAQSILNVNNNASQAASGILSMQQQVEQLKTSTQYFFSLRNMINLLKRGVREAVDTVKELDKAMTETAVVVPEWDVGDMWAKLPTYTKNANALGSTVVDLYKATTLYYQQGLRGNEVMDIAAETMKMARIGGLEAADATDKMTAALRGFNMEINATSAQRVNDVYSNLAANTASNTEELGTAMQRTASIANSAGMSFEGTAAFLAQAIETTREPAENLGTAMKTIVARFTELKKNPLEITEVEGEEVSYNKVDAALQSIGVSLKDANGQFRDLDQVFLDISERWDNLTQTQQRYVATQAAGSRQQSRFIAMMSNYKRTVELMNYANNSEGASQKQFNKTLDSFEAKVNKLQNAWKEFLMGIANNSFVKGAVDGLTTLIGGVNKLIDTLSLGLGPVKSFLSLFTAFVGLKMGGRLINSLIGGLGGMVDPTSNFGMGFRTGMTGRGNPALASQIYTPIVNAINGLKGTVNNSKLTPEQQRYQSYIGAAKDIKNLGKTFKVNDLTKSLKGVSANNQTLLMRGYSGTFGAATRAIIDKWTKEVTKDYGNTTGRKRSAQYNSKEFAGAIRKGERQLNKDRMLGKATVDEYYNNLQDPRILRQAAIDAGVDKNNAAMVYLQKQDEAVTKQARDAVFNEQFGKRISEQLASYDKYVATDKGKNDTNIVSREELEKRLKAEYRKQLDEDSVNKKRSEILKQQQEKNGVIGQSTKTEQAINAIGRFGTGVTSAGMGLQAFGSTLANSANPALAAFGTAISGIGGLLSGLGMAVTGITGAFSAVATSGIMTGISTALFGTAAAASALTGGLFLLLAAVAGVAIGIQLHNKKIKEEAEKVSTDYEEKSKEVKTNLNNLRTWQQEAPRLSKGVDENGNNINLTNEDYQHYLEMANGIAKINPKIVKGYNAQGDAIVDINSALEQTIALEEERGEKAFSDYISDKSIRKLDRALRVDKKQVKVGTTIGRKPITDGYELSSQAEQRSAVNKVMSQLNQAAAKGYIDKNLFEQMGLKPNEAGNFVGNDETVKAFVEHADEIGDAYQKAMKEAGQEISDSNQELWDNSMTELSEAIDKYEEQITPMYEALVARATEEINYGQLDEDMIPFLNEGIKEIASDLSLDSDQKIKNVGVLVDKFNELTNGSEEYKKAISDIEEAQNNYADTLNKTDYKGAIEEPLKDLETIKNKLLESDDAYSQALAEMLTTRIEQTRKFTEESAADISDGLNTMTDEISAAEGALESFKKTAEGSNYSTAAEGMKEIFDTVMEKGDNGAPNKHAEGFGDQTYWTAAETFFGRDKLKNASKADVDKMFNNIKPMLEEGQKGFDAFYYKVQDNRVALEKLAKESGGALEMQDGWFKSIDSSKAPDIYQKIAESLGMSEEFLTSMLNKGRQFAQIDFTDLNQVRRGLVDSDQIIVGKDEDVKGKKNIYMKEEALNAELINGGVTTVQEQEKVKRQLEKEQGIKVISEAAKIGIKEFQDMGIHSQESLIATLDATGQYTKDEIEEYAKRYAEVNEKAAEFNREDFNAAFTAHEAAKNPADGEKIKSLKDIATDTAAIADAVVNNRIEEGHLDKSLAKETRNMLIGKDGKTDTEAELFAQGKNVKGELISREEYKQTSKDLGGFITESQAYIEELKQGKENAKTKEDKEKIQKEIDAFTEMVALAKQMQEDGEKGYHEANNQRIEAINEKTGGLLEGKTWKDFKGKKADALQKVYEASLEPITEITDGFVKDLDTLGITVDEAKNKGLVTKDAYNAWTEQQEEYIKQEEEKKKQRREKARKTANKNIEAINEKTGGLLEGKTWKDFKGKENRAALKEVAQAAQEPITEITDSFINSLSTIGLDLDQAFGNGLVTEDAYNAWKQKAAENEFKLRQAEREGQDEANQGALSEVKEDAKISEEEKNKNREEGIKAAVGGVGDTIKTAAEGLNNIDFTGLEDAGDNAEDAGSKIGEASKEAANQSELYSQNTAKIGEVFSSFIKGISDGLSGLTKGAREFNEAAGSSPSLQGKPKQKGTTIPGVGFVPSGGKTEKKEPEKQAPQPQAATLTINADYTQVTEAKKEIKSTIKTAEKGAELKVTSTNDVESTQKKLGQVQKQVSKGVRGGKVSLSTSADTSGAYKGIDNIIAKAKKTTAKVKVTSVKASGAYKAIDELKDYAKESVSFGVDVKSGNKRSFNVTVEGKYLGQNNTGRVPQLPNIGSAATGTSKPGTGRLGPRGKGGLTLTGELGYEVAWLPHEHRSMILGTKGPEMVNLPGDAVVWNHEQSKQIVKKNAIPSGSAWIGAGSASEQNVSFGTYTPKYSRQQVYSGGKVTRGGSTTKGQNRSNSKKNNKYQEKILKQTWKLLGTAGKISNWWEDISRQVEGIQRIADRNQKAFKKLIDTAGTTLSDVQKNSETYSKSLQKSIQLNEEIVKHYKDKLDALTSGKGQSAKSRKGAVSGINKAANEVTKAEAKVELAKQTKSKKDDKKAKKNLRNAKKRLKNAKKKDKSAAVDTVTYDDEIQVTTKKKTRKGKGKWKNKTVKKKKKVKSTRAVDWSKIIEYDAETDTWVLNDKEINKQAGGNKKAAKAIKEKGNKKIDEMIQRRNGAQDKIDSARESLNQLAEDVYQMFSRWEKSLTHVYLISQKLESLQKKADIYDTQEEYLSTKALAGYNPFSQESLDKLNTILTNRQNSLVEQAKAQKDLVDATYKQYEEAFQLGTYLTNGNIGSETGGESQSGVNEQEAASIAFQLLKKAGAENIDTYDSVKVQQAYDEYTKGRYTNKTDEEVKKILDRIAEYQGSYYDALKESYTSVTEIYKTLNEYEEYINDFEESLLKGLEEEINKEIDKQEKLNSALTDAFKDLLDEVKRRLDQRRQAEDNAKTESDIAKKQQRLATLQADTSGGHASEIKQLQQEIAEAQQSYGRTLEDQLLERLQQQGDEAAKQRERQIKLLEIQRDLAEALGTNLEEVKEWLQNPEANKEQIKAAWLTNQNYDEALPEQQKALENQFEEAWTKYLAYGARAQDLREFLDEVNFDNTPQKQAAQSLQKIETNLGGLKQTIEKEVKERQAAAGEKSHNYINEVEEPTIDYGKISDFKENGVELEEARTKAENLGIDNSYASMREGGYTAEDFKKAKVSASDALGAGFSHTQLKEGGYTAEDFKKADLGAVEAAKAGFGYGDLIKGGYTYQDILDQREEFEALARANGGLNSTFVAEALAQQKEEEKRKKEREQQKQIALRDVKNIAEQIDPNNPTGKKKKEMLVAWATNNNSFLKEFAGMAIPMKTGSGHINSNGQLYFNDKKGNVKRFNFTNGKFSNVKYNQKDWEKHAGYNQVSDTPYIMAEFQQALKKRNAKKYTKFTNKAPILEAVPIANAIAAYASGGMNYTTGPAWLDGTRAKPEAVLNATDTKNFIALKDILSDVMGHITDNNTTTYGDSTYEININVDHLNNDYDVDKVAKRVEKIITADASYRNVTMVRKFR